MRTAWTSVLLVTATATAGLAGAGCLAGAPGAADGSQVAPLVGVDGSTDQADHACNVVLRDLARPSNGTGGYETNDVSWVWRGTVEVSAAADAEGLTPAVLYQYGSDPTWYQATVTPSTLPATGGFVRYDVVIDDHVPGPGMSGTALTRATIQVAPLLALDGGGRLFDHNRNPGDFDNYVLDWDHDFRVAPAAAVCPATTGPQPARLIFAADYTVAQDGALDPGGQVRVEYDVARLTTCRGSQAGNPLWDITAHARWQPSGALADGSVSGGAATFDIPADATGLELWFENTSAYGCQAWDSNYGANYPFDVLAPPAWIGAATMRISRDSSDPCDAGLGDAVPAEDGFSFDSWARTRATVTNACFRVWQPGLTDRDDPDLWQKLDARVRWRAAGSSDPWREAAVPIDRRVGNDARYAFDLRSIDPFRMYHCPDVPVTDDGNGTVSAAIEWYALVNGKELRPAAGGAFPGTFADNAGDPWRAANCP